ncbi:SRPBCC domain-containing protein [Paenibacillus glycinis]|uniref:SRPBCC domain-containing protein n=1 Tax=Paenibacillus glycinis TaxID=2697035 RepID=A0ABW9XK17_9BACL|nr:SRPBCC domain-containing protein [Paenibacillus glycinis]NBD22943.1 SRPBCC domain-containing protein [Paenibacillus glycinis]
MANQMTATVEGKELILERVFKAPSKLVFQAFSDAEHLKRWWGPRGWDLTVCTVDFRPGGVWHYCMKCMDPNQGDFFGMESWGKAIYEDMVEAKKIVYVDYFSDAEGSTVEGMPSSHITMTFIEQDGATKLISRARYESEEALRKVIEMGMEQGVTETWDRLAEHLASQQ